MRVIKNTLYVTTPGSYLSLDGENVVISRDRDEVGRVPIHLLQGIIVFGYSSASPALMGKCAENSIEISFLTMHGRFLGRFSGEVKGNVLLRREQYRIADDAQRSLDIAKSFILGKLFNSRWVIERTARDYPMRADSEKLKKASEQIYNLMKQVENCPNDGVLRGIEGDAASIYFQVFDEMILRQKEDFKFSVRNKRPPLDPVNALLSFAYTLLAHEAAWALSAVGLDPYVGFLHKDRPGRLSLGLDLMEEFRSVLADRFVLTLINKNQVKRGDFSYKENGAVYLNDNGRGEVLKLWQKKKAEAITHPFTKEKMQWGMVIFVQAQLLARYIRGDLDAYPPLMWK
ncbi:MAG: type I-C CRISPR-associated endonuclease Cas1c [Firmicutes bacterium]|nr:type I-C CRISPR-associated endonuclease Cas1c [Bacillota bacterium]